MLHFDKIKSSATARLCHARHTSLFCLSTPAEGVFQAADLGGSNRGEAKAKSISATAAQTRCKRLMWCKSGLLIQPAGMTRVTGCLHGNIDLRLM